MTRTIEYVMLSFMAVALAFLVVKTMADKVTTSLNETAETIFLPVQP